MNIIALIYAISLAGEPDTATARYKTMAECEAAKFIIMDSIRSKPVFKSAAVVCVELTKLEAL